MTRIIQARRKTGKTVASPLSVYRKLLSSFGRQGWWPVSPNEGGGPVYRKGYYGPLAESERFEICVGAILTQNTAWTNVEKALRELIRGGGIDPERIIAIPDAVLQGKIRPSGYFVQKARKLKAFSLFVLEVCGGDMAGWLSGPLADRRTALLDVYGVGPETADSILLYAGGRSVFVVDAYTRRLARRMGWIKGAYSEVQEYFVAALPGDAELYNEYHALIVRLAKDFCTKTHPDCAVCPLNGCCSKILED